MNEQLERIRDDYFKSLAATFEVRSKGFRGLSLALITFALAFFFFILLPNVLLQTESAAVADRLRVLEREQTNSRKLAEACEKAVQGVALLQDKIGSGAAELRQFIVANVSSGSSSTDTPNLGEQRPQEVDPPSLDEKIRAKLDAMIVGYVTIAQDEIVQPLKQTGNDGLANQLDHLPETIAESFKTHLEATPQFWQTVETKEGFFGELNAEFQSSWKELAQTANLQPEKMKELKEKQAVLSKDIEKMKADNLSLVAKRKEYSDRLEKIQSPLGNLPVGLSEAILIFPILLSIGFVVLAYQFRDMLRLRQELYHLTREKDPEQQVITDHRFELTAPIWFDRTISQRSEGFGQGLALLPPALVLLTIALIVYSWCISEELHSVPHSEWIYGTLYAICLAGVFLQWRRLSRELAELPRHQPTSA